MRAILEEFKKNWLTNILGIIFFVFGFGVLNVNEARYFKHTSVLNEASKEIISINEHNEAAIYKTPNYEGKMIHLIGELKIREGLGDSQYNILVQSVKLRKIVEIYQWHEDYIDNSFSTTDDDSKRNYIYYKDWSEKIIDSRSFHSMMHQNPSKKPIESKTNIAEKAYIGNFEIGEEAKEKFNTWIDVTSDTKPDDIFIKMHSGAYYHSEDIFNPQIGDVRIKFQFAGLEGEIWTICGQFEKGIIVPYVRKNKKILLLSKGRLSIDDIFHQEHFSTSKEVWFTRLFGFFLIMFSIISTENINRVAFSRTPFSFLILDNNKKLRSILKIAALFTITICIFRQSLHYLHILN
ncbi:hypothetical protein PVAND_002924 [Polypedilum vanderplanki]|uniref:Uncharacterized protein n=1 Tax=Polypedilum vanderplanki TaxID=319348 RepID=A0A9J6BSW8_POLVA|nr:hypothetical protein PVAND_002924 [Polypedilum vanderplanki]